MSDVQIYERAYNHFLTVTEADLVDNTPEELVEQWATEHECLDKKDVVEDAQDSAFKFTGLEFRGN